MPPSPISNTVLARNIDIALTEAIVQISHAEQVGTRARTGYYKVAMLLLASVIEAQLHHLIILHEANDSTIFDGHGKKKLVKIAQLNSANLGTTKALFICEEVIESFKLSKHTLLAAMNDFCLANSFIPARLKANIDSVKDKRNELHLQSLRTVSRTFTRDMIDKAGYTVAELFELIDDISTASAEQRST